MNNTLQQSSKAGSPVTEATTTSTSTSPSEAYPCEWAFEADLFELQLDVPPSRSLRRRVASHLDGVSLERVMKASRFCLLHWMLKQETRNAQLEREEQGVAH
jgi:hypothetical protein